MLSTPEFINKQIIFVFTNEGDKLSFLNDNIIVKNKEGKIKHQSTCYRLFMIFIVGNISVTSGLIQRCQKFGFSICLMTPSLRVYHIIGGIAEGNTMLHKLQYNYSGADIGKRIIINKISNQKSLLSNFRYKSEQIKEVISLLDDYIIKLSAENLDYQQIMGIEGVAAKIYFAQVFNNALWNGRKPRIKNDYINSTLDIGYSILFNIIDAILGSYGFDRYYGVFHRCFYMRKSLVCDMMEPFRTIIDKQIRKSINLNQCREEDFNVVNKRYLLSWNENPKYVSFLIAAIMDYKKEIFEYIQAYYRAVMKEKSVEEFPFFEMR